jgi:ElaB/YqjD/DUF883 family membrane-anchored ribosome-binding protein
VAEYVKRAIDLSKFLEEIGHEGGVKGLDGAETTRQSLEKDMRKHYLGELEVLSGELDEKLNTPTGKRKRGDGRREQLFTNSDAKIADIMALAEYHATVLGVMADGVREKAAELHAKAKEFLTRDFDAAPQAARATAVEVAATAVDEAEEWVDICEVTIPTVTANADVDDPFA